MIDSVAALVAQQLQTPLMGTAFHLQHLAEFERFQARMREIKRQCNSGNTRGRQPFVAEITSGPQQKPALRQFAVELLDARFEFAPLNVHTEITNALIEEIFIRERDPVRLRLRRESLESDFW